MSIRNKSIRWIPYIYEPAQMVKLYLRHYFMIFLSGENNRLLEYKDIHKGERCFVIATGPSLTIRDLELISGETTFSVNSIVKLLKKTDWRPTYLCVSDSCIWPQIREDVELYSNSIEAIFLYKWGMKCSSKNVIRYKLDRAPAIYKATEYYKRTQKENPYFDLYLSSVPERYFCDAHTVIYIVIQLAIYMGFSEIYLLGADCDYHSGSKYSKDIDNYKTVLWNNAEELLMRCYRTVKEEIIKKKLPVNIYNATRGGILEIFPRVTLEDVI